MNRKSFIKNFGLLLASFLSLPNFFHAKHKKRGGLNSFSDPTTMIALAQTTLSLVNKLSTPAKSPILSFLEFQTQYLNVISQDLDNIKHSLDRLQISINQLPSEIKNILKDQYSFELITQIKGSVSRYNNIILKNIISDSRFINQDSAKSALNDIINSLQNNIHTIRQLEKGIGPGACMVAPLAMNIEISARINRGDRNSTLKTVISDYRNWFMDITSDKPGSINVLIQKSIKSHDYVLMALDNDDLAKRYGLSNFKLSGSQEASEIYDPCLLAVALPPSIFSDVRWKENVLFDANKIADHFFFSAYTKQNELSAKTDSILGVKLIRLEKVLEMKAINNRNHVKMVKPNKPDSYCYWYLPDNYSPNIFSEEPLSVSDSVLEEEIKKRLEQNPDNVSRENIEIAIAKANLERANLSFYNTAHFVASNNINIIDKYLSVL